MCFTLACFKILYNDGPWSVQGCEKSLKCLITSVLRCYSVCPDRTEEAVLSYVLINVLQVTSWLEVSSIGVKVIMRHGLFDAHAEAHTLVGEGVDGIHKFSVVRRQSVRGRHAFKQRPRWIKAWKTHTHTHAIKSRFVLEYRINK